MNLIHKTQYGFIKTRSIQDCRLGLWNNFTYAINKKQMVILKLDIEKVFDTIEHEAILKILLAKGFGEK
jgi:retron-type reverse transcriptase